MHEKSQLKLFSTYLKLNCVCKYSFVCKMLHFNSLDLLLGTLKNWFWFWWTFIKLKKSQHESVSYDIQARKSTINFYIVFANDKIFLTPNHHQFWNRTYIQWLCTFSERNQQNEHFFCLGHTTFKLQMTWRKRRGRPGYKSSPFKMFRQIYFQNVETFKSALHATAIAIR